MKDSWHCSLEAIKSPNGVKGEVSLWLLGKLKELQTLRYWPHPFATVSELFDAFNYQPTKKREWRLTDFDLGHINGLPASYGRLAATDGILCVIITGTGLFEGHIASFVHEYNLDDVIEPRINASSRKNKTKNKTVCPSLDMFL